MSNEHTLHEIPNGDAAEARAIDQAMPQIYGELRAMAHRLLARESSACTIHTTVLVHEAYLKLYDKQEVSAKGRAYFFGSAARCMRQILVDHARQRGRLKRGGGVAAVTLVTDHANLADFSDRLVDLDRALTRLEALSERQVRVAECRIFAGLDVDQTAMALDISARTVKREWAVTQAWLYRVLERGEEG